jgi:tagatose 6-phosphate kinase
VHAEQIKSHIRKLAANSRLVVVSGSLPPGLLPDLYRELIEIIKECGATAFLDASGAALAAGLQAKPNFIKPNEEEMSTLLNAMNMSDEILAAGIQRLMNEGISTVAVTLGAAGSIVGSEGKLYRIEAPRVEALSSVGCGDTFVGAMAVATCRGWSIEDRLRFATAAASANALTAQTGHIDPHTVNALMEQVRIIVL